MYLTRNLLIVAALLALLSAIAPAAPSAKLKAMAPADQYFGKLKLSFLGINNTFRDAGISAADHTTDPTVVNKVDFAIDALNDWQKKFPADPQLSRTYFLAQITLKKIWIQKYQDKAWSYMQHLLVAYPATFYAKTVKAEIARGFTRHYYAVAVPCDASATPAPSVTTDNGKYKTVVETPPCITPSPSPSPSIEPTPSLEAPAQPSPPAASSPAPALSTSPLPLPPASAPPQPSASPIPAASLSPVPPSSPVPTASASPLPAGPPSPAATTSPMPAGSPLSSPSPSAK
jgi:hypothetical protein